MFSLFYNLLCLFIFLLFFNENVAHWKYTQNYNQFFGKGGGGGSGFKEMNQSEKQLINNIPCCTCVMLPQADCVQSCHFIDYMNSHMWETTVISEGRSRQETSRRSLRRTEQTACLSFCIHFFFSLFWSDSHNPQAIICGCLVICGKASPSPCSSIRTSSLHPALTL